MIIAVLFNSDDPKFEGFYGPPIRDLILETLVLQRSGRQLKVLHGDVLVLSYAKNSHDYERIADATYFAGTWSTVVPDRIRATYLKATIWAWVIQNVTKEVAQQLDVALASDSSYLGLHVVYYSIPFHLALYRNSMPAYCRICSSWCSLFYSMGNEDDKDDYEAERFRELGFTEVIWEDRGAHGTIFDDFDSLEHFEQLREVQKVLASVLHGGDDEAEELVMMLEDLNPRLFNVLASAIRALSNARTEEDYAHVGISGRRYIEQLADALFPPSRTMVNGRDVSAPMFRNRIWAFIERTIPSGQPDRVSTVRSLGREVDRLAEAANSLLHGTPDRAAAAETFRDLARLSAALLQIDPKATRRPYLAFEKKMTDFLRNHVNEIRQESASGSAS